MSPNGLILLPNAHLQDGGGGAKCISQEISRSDEESRGGRSFVCSLLRSLVRLVRFRSFPIPHSIVVATKRDDVGRGAERWALGMMMEFSFHPDSKPPGAPKKVQCGPLSMSVNK